MPTILVENLPPGTTEETLQQTSSESGEVKEMKVITHHGPDNIASAVLSFSSQDEAEAAISNLKGKEFEEGAVKAKYYEHAIDRL